MNDSTATTAGGVTRSSGPQADAWWLDEPEPTPADTYTDEWGEVCLDTLSETLDHLQGALGDTDYVLGNAARYMAEHLHGEELVATVALIQDLKRRLGVAEAYLAREAGRMRGEGSLHGEGRLPDGRAFEVLRGSIRKAWDHGLWQTDVRHRVAAENVPGGLVDPATGEEVSVLAAFAAVQAVHGSTAPKAKALKALGLDADNYCESSPGPWAVKVTQ